MRPPFSITPEVLNLVSEISLMLGKYEGLHAPVPRPQLRKQNRILTIQGSLAIEGNTLDLEQVTAIFANQRVLGPRKDILEVQNAIHLYESLRTLKPNRIPGLLQAHRVLMKGLSPDAGKFRTGAVGVLKGSKVTHVAPPAKRVPELMESLFNYWKSEKKLSPLILACVIHYEIEFIHPFSDGNGRIGRFLQTWILSQYHRAFEFLPIESLIKDRQSEYYEVLRESDKKGDSTAFIIFSLTAIRDALNEFLVALKPEPPTPESRLDFARSHFGNRAFSRKDYLLLLKSVSTATASRDLVHGVASGVLEKFGAHATSRYTFR